MTNFEIVRTGNRQFHSRFKSSGNHEIVWVTESYKTKRAAINAIHALVEAITVGQHIGSDMFVANSTPVQAEEAGQPIAFSFAFVDETRTSLPRTTRVES